MKRLLSLFFLVFVLTLPSCKSEFEFVEGSLRPGTAEATLSGGNVTMNFPSSAGSASVELNASGDWTATFVNDRATDWCSVSKESGGRGVAGISVSVRENTDYEQRSATINFTCGDLRRTIVVTQKQKEAILVTSNRVDVGKDGGRISIEVKANVTFDYAVSDNAKDWIRAVRAKSLTTTTLLFDVTANDGVEKREGEIVVSGSAGREVVKVYQEGETPTLVVSRNNYDLTCDAQEIRVEVQHNVDVKLEIPSGCDWLRETSTKSMSTSTFSLTVDENEAFSERSCELRFKASALNMEEKVVVRQAAAVPQLFIGEGVYGFGVEGGDLSIDVTSNFGISVEVPDTCSWIKNVTTKGMTTETFNFTIEENDTFANRSGVILFHNESLGITETVTVRQAAAEPQIIIGEGVYEFGVEGGNLSIDVLSNFGISVEVPDTCSWIKVVGTKGMTAKNFNFTIEENDTYADRSGVILFHNESLGITEKIIILQEGEAPQLIIGKTLYEIEAEGGSLSIEVTSNLGLTVTVPDSCSWIKSMTTKTLSVRSFDFVVEENEAFAGREGVIIFANEAQGITETVTVRQAAAEPQIIIGEGVYEFGVEGGDLSIDVQSNFGISVEVPDTCSWIKVVGTKGMTTKNFNFTIEENDTYADRSGVILFHNESLGITEKVVVRQRQKDAIVVSNKYFEVPGEGGQVEVRIDHNIDYRLYFEDSWIRQVDTKGLTTDVLLFDIKANDGLYAREGRVQIKSARQTDTLVFHQDHPAYFVRVLSPESRELDTDGGQLVLELEHNPYGFRYTQLVPLNPEESGERFVFMIPQTHSDSPTRTTATVGYTANKLRETRYASLVLFNFNDTQVDTLRFFQPPVPILTSDSLVFIPSAASDFSFRVAGTSTSQYSIEKNASWLKMDHVETKDGELEYHWKANANPNAAMRMAKISIYPTKGGWPDVLQICQEGGGLSFSVTYSSRKVIAPALYGTFREYSTIWWGDGRRQTFTDGATHTYSGSGKHTITVETNRMKFIDWAEVSSFEDGMHIDFSNIAGRKN